MDDSLHIPVLLDEVLVWLKPRPDGCYVDCTLGQGGIAQRILEQTTPGGMFIGIDQDPRAISRALVLLKPYLARAQFYCKNFQHIASVMEAAGMNQADGILFDLGISSAQLADPSRGFSFQNDGPLDMRMSPSQEITAERLLYSLSESELARIIYDFGEERFSRRIAKAIIKAKEEFKLQTTFELSSVIQQAVPHSYRHGRLHPATRTFQALRIAVNNELNILPQALQDAAEVLAPGGRLCVISFHSLEDRLVKHTFRTLAEESRRRFLILTKKPCTPTLEERQRNRRSRSAKLRVLECAYKSSAKIKNQMI